MDATAGLESGPAAGVGDRRAQRVDREVVQQDQGGAGGQGFVELVQAGDFDLHQHARGSAALRGTHGRADSTGRADVVFLDQHAVIQAGAVVARAADAHRVLLQHAHAWRRLAGVDDGGVAADDELHGAPTDGRHP